MKSRYYHYLLATLSLLFLLSCGTQTNNKDINRQQKDQKEVLTKDNYISLAKFHFSKESQRLLKDKGYDENNNKKFRSYPGAKGGELSNSSNTGLLKISSVTPFNKYVESMIISSPKKEIKVEVKNRLYAIISLYENGKLVKTTKQTMYQFRKFNLTDQGEEL